MSKPTKDRTENQFNLVSIHCPWSKTGPFNVKKQKENSWLGKRYKKENRWLGKRYFETFSIP